MSSGGRRIEKIYDLVDGVAIIYDQDPADIRRFTPDDEPEELGEVVQYQTPSTAPSEDLGPALRRALGLE